MIDISNNQKSRYVVLNPMSLLAPISSEVPTGKYLRYEDAYHRIQTEIAKGKSLPAIEVGREHLVKPDWNHVRSICHNALEKQSKDILLTIWLSVSLLHTEGFRGLQEGFQLLEDLCAMFWDDIHPTADGDPERRLAPFFWLEQKLPEYLLLANLFPHAGEAGSVSPSDEHPFSVATLRRSQAIWDQLAQASSAQSVNTLPDVMDAAQKKFLLATRHSPDGFHRSIVDAVQTMSKIMLRLKERLLEEFGSEAPSFSSSIELLKQIEVINTYVACLSTDDTTLSRPISDGGANSGAGNSTNEDHKAMQVLFEKLERIAEKLIKNAPNCPTGYLAQQAVACRTMTMKNALYLFIPNTDLWKRVCLHVPDASLSNMSVTDRF